MRGVWIRKPIGDAAVVFVHGILSSGESCWRHGNGAYWPELLKNEAAVNDWGIYAYSYETGVFSGAYNLNDVVDDLKERFLNLDGIADYRRVVFVCHSMGGIVVRKFLVERVNDLLDRNIEAGLFLVASPSLGSAYANWLSPLAKFMGHGQADALRFSQNNTWLNGLDKEFLNLKESGRLNLTGKELVEDKFVVLPKFLRKQVVEPFAGARYFGEPYKVPGSDHFSIAKPAGAEADQHRLLLAFIEKIGEVSGTKNGLTASFPKNREPKPAPQAGPDLSFLPATSPRRPPGEALPPGDPFYLRRDADDRLDEELLDYGQTFTIKAPEQMGKTSLLLRYLAKCEKSGKKTVLIDFRPYSDAELADRQGFLNQLADDILEQLGRPRFFSRQLEFCKDFTGFLRDAVLKTNKEPIVLAFDNVDRLIEVQYRDDFFYTLRTWSDLRAREPGKGWRGLSLILAVATEPSLLIKDPYRSPFSVTDPIRLQTFDIGAIGRLNEISGGRLDNPGVEQVYELLGGHPYLSQWAFHRLAGPRPISLEQLLTKACADDGPFAEQLRTKYQRLSNHPELAASFRDLLHKGMQPDEFTYHRLQTLGLVRRDDLDKVVPANLIYTRFFARVLR